ncbi:hypothetical protein L3X38_010468 [Prunus dulcis]|uniref:Uncharacterized protein n=1 Tax=Prunus dulcis TaxID=3755 RepID=A0AAD4ZET1_PRUDU|nr:hypothetical protein L3X38_010468 [Prunus dulcis]
MKIDGECLIELIGSCRNKVQVYRSVRMPQLHTSLHFHLTPIVMINGSSSRDLLLNSQNFCRSTPPGQKTHRCLGCATGGSGEVGIGEHSSWVNLPSAFALEGQSPSSPRKPLHASVTFWEAYAP